MACVSMARTSRSDRKTGSVPRVVANEVTKDIRKKKKEAAVKEREAKRIAKEKKKIAEKEAKAKAKREMKATAHSLRNSQEYVELHRGVRTVFRIYKHNSM